MKHTLNFKTIDRFHNLRGNWLLLFVFVWFLMAQVALVHSAQHALEQDNNCPVCLAQSNLSSATVNTPQSTPAVTITDFIISFEPRQFVAVLYRQFSSRDPPHFLPLNI